MRHSYGARLGRLQIRPLDSKDLELLRQWRNDEKISKFFRNVGYISFEKQREWFEKYQCQPDTYYWSLVDEDKVVGALAIYNIDNKTAEIGKIMIGDLEARGKGYGYQAFLMAIKIGFEFLGLQVFRLDVHEKNSAAFISYKRAGFKIVGLHPFDEEGCEYEMEILKDGFEEINPMSGSIIVYSEQIGSRNLEPADQSPAVG